MKLDRSWTPALAVAVIALISGGWLLQQGDAARSSGDYSNARLFEQVHHIVSQRYVEEVDSGELYQMAIEGMLSELGDPHTTFLDSAEYADLQLNTTGNYGGLGIRIESQDDWITVVDVLPDTPADRVGLQPGDRIIEVKGESAKGWSTTDAVKVLRGPKGSSVHVTVARVGVNKPLGFEITRDEVHVTSVHSFMLDDRVGYVRLQQFSEQAQRELESAINGLIDEGAKSLVLDLSANPGGLLDQGVAVADLFLPEGAKVVSTKSRVRGQSETYTAPNPEKYGNLPVAVVVSRYSASASEIVAGALQDHDRAVVVGSRTFGKGSVQSLFGLAGNNYLKMTTAQWYTPVGRSIQRDRGEDSQMSELMANTISVSGNAISTATTDTSEQQVYHTDSGRAVYGGGGITPDLLVSTDTLTSPEQEFRSELSEAGVILDNAAFQFGVKWAKEHDLQPGFQITDAIRDAFYRRLVEESDVEVERELYDSAAGWVDWNLRLQIASAAFGPEERLRQRVAFDRPIQRAASLLRDAGTPDEVITLAERQKRETATAGGETSGDGGSE